MYRILAILSAMVLWMASSPLPAQTHLYASVRDGIEFTSLPAEGIYRIDPDTQSVAMLLRDSITIDVAAGNDPHTIYLLQGFGSKRQIRELPLDGGEGGLLVLSNSPHGLGEGKDGWHYAAGPSQQMSNIDFEAQDVYEHSSEQTFRDFAALTHGRLIAVTESNELVRVAPSTGFTESIVPLIGPQMSRLAVSHDGRVWGLSGSSLYELSLETGQTTFVMSLPEFGMKNTEWGLASEPGPANPSNLIQLSGPAQVDVGTNAQFDYSNATPGGWYALFISESSAGHWMGGQPFDLGLPVKVAANGVVPASGADTIIRYIPPDFAGLTLYVELGSFLQTTPSYTEDSNMITLVVN